MIPDTWLQRASNTEGQSQGKISTNAPKHNVKVISVIFTLIQFIGIH